MASTGLSHCYFYVWTTHGSFRKTRISWLKVDGHKNSLQNFHKKHYLKYLFKQKVNNVDSWMILIYCIYLNKRRSIYLFFGTSSAAFVRSSVFLRAAFSANFVITTLIIVYYYSRSPLSAITSSPGTKWQYKLLFAQIYWSVVLPP